MLPYIDRETGQGVALNSITRHMLGLYHGLRGARLWRQVWSDHRLKPLPAREVLQRARLALASGATVVNLGGGFHHALSDRGQGFCVFNDPACAIRKLQRDRRIERALVLDCDLHHGNGTENIFRDHSQVLFVSLHQSPCYPGTGLRSAGNCHNYPLPPGTGPAEYLAACDRALAVVAAFKPQLVAVSAGFDAYWRDPITDMRLDIDTFGEIGRRIRALGQPAFAVLEGGYAEDLGDCVAAFIAGWEPPAGVTTSTVLSISALRKPVWMNINRTANPMPPAATIRRMTPSTANSANAINVATSNARVRMRRMPTASTSRSFCWARVLMISLDAASSFLRSASCVSRACKRPSGLSVVGPCPGAAGCSRIESQSFFAPRATVGAAAITSPHGMTLNAVNQPATLLLRK